MRVWSQLYAVNADGGFRIPQYINLPNNVQVHRDKAGLDDPMTALRGAARNILLWNPAVREYIDYTHEVEAMFHLMLCQQEGEYKNQHMLEVIGRSYGRHLQQVFLRVYY
jgi:hypothetical protein